MRNEQLSHASAVWNIEETIEAENAPVMSGTVQALMEAFDIRYNRRHASTTVNISYTVDGIEILKYSGRLLPLSEVDAKYPRTSWIQMFLDNNIPIDSFDVYWQCLIKRDQLVRIEKDPQVWVSGLFEIPSTTDWDIYEQVYIDRLMRIEKE